MPPFFVGLKRHFRDSDAESDEMKSRQQNRLHHGIVLALLLSAPLADAGPSCQSDNLQAEIACLKDLGISIDRFMEEYLHLVTDLRAKLAELNAESARCAELRRSYQDYRDSLLLSKIESLCEGEWLENRVRRFNQIRKHYESAKARYERIRELYGTAKELLAVIESRQANLEREYAERKVNR